MKCPVCDETLTSAERQGVEIDFCQKCRGVWLDSGELDKILLREAALETALAAPRNIRASREGDDDDDDRYPRRKRSIWHDIVD